MSKIEERRTPNGFDIILKPDNPQYPIKLVNQTGHDLKLVKVEENVYFVYVDDYPSDGNKETNHGDSK